MAFLIAGRYCSRHDLWQYVASTPLDPTRKSPRAKNKIVGIGAAYGTAKSGIGIAGVGTFRPDLIMKVRDNLYRITI